MIRPELFAQYVRWMIRPLKGQYIAESGFDSYVKTIDEVILLADETAEFTVHLADGSQFHIRVKP